MAYMILAVSSVADCHLDCSESFDLVGTTPSMHRQLLWQERQKLGNPDSQAVSCQSTEQISHLVTLAGSLVEKALQCSRVTVVLILWCPKR